MGDEKKSDENKGRFWGALLATFVVTLGSNTWLNTYLNDGHEKQVTEGAKTAAEEAARAKSEEREKTIARFFNETLKPEVDKRFADHDASLVELEGRLEQCTQLAASADREAYAALRIAESRFGRRTVERTLERVEDEVKPPPKKPSIVQTQTKLLPEYILENKGN